MEKTTKSDLRVSSKKLILKIGNKTICILDGEIVKRLGIIEGSTCEQTITEDGAIMLRIKKISDGGQNDTIC